jgi:hypothetical protein
LLEESREENHHLLQEYDINLQATLVWEKILLQYHSTLGAPMSGILKSRFDIINRQVAWSWRKEPR